MNSVLIVEDEELIIRGLTFAINWTDLGCFVAGTARNGVEGLTAIRTISPDIVLADISMPIMNGLEMLEIARDEGYTFAALIITGHDEFELAKKAIGIGVVDYLLKPLDHKALAEVIENCKVQLDRMKYYEAAKKAPSLEERVLPPHASISRLVGDAVEYVENCYREKFGIQDIADHLDVSYSTLSKQFKQEIGFTLNDFINRFRIMKSIELMKSEKDAIYLIAEQVGFSDYKYFIKVFTKYLGVTPSLFMKSRDVFQ
ncbi:MAG: response regulator [Sphaerochaeta sp.]|nr:response regulator [Sphaerochaeta sp.]